MSIKRSNSVVWTPSLHKQFEEALAAVGKDGAALPVMAAALNPRMPQVGPRRS